MALNKIHVALSDKNEKYRNLDLSFHIDTDKCGRCGKPIEDIGLLRMCDNCFKWCEENTPKGLY